MAANDFAVDPESIDRTVYVTNVASTASIEKISEFFGFCGKIRSLRLRKTEDETQEALVEFEASSASKTALMLKEALIEGVPINVSPLSQESLPPPSLERTDSQVEQANLEGQRYANDSEDQERTSTSVVASLLGAGYTLGNNAFQTAVQYDQQNQLSQKAAEVYETVKTTAKAYDNQYGVSTSVTNLWEQSKAAAMPYVQAGSEAAAPYVAKTSEAAAPYLDSAKVAATNAMENPSVQSAFNSVNTSVTTLTEETKKDIEARQAAQQAQQVPGEEGQEQQSQQVPGQEAQEQQPQPQEQQQQPQPQEQQQPPKGDDEVL